MDMSANSKILVIGGGISGITAAVEASEAGADVLLVEKNPYLGGRVAQMNLYFPKLCPPNCGLEINMRRFRTSAKIQYLTQAEVTDITGEPGSYEVTIRQKPRFVNEKCTVCGDCVAACPVERSDSFNLGMAQTKAAYLPFPTAFPMRFVIDGEACKGSECGECAKACKYDAIELDMSEKTVKKKVASVVVATGWEPFEAASIENLGFENSEDIISNLQMERLAAPDGPTAGKILRPSDGAEVNRVAFVQCAGSRDENYLKHCSGICCMASLKQARYFREQYPDAEIYIFYIDIRSPGRLEDFYAESQQDEKLTLIKGKVAKIEPHASGKSLSVEAEDVLSGARVRQEVDLVVLATGMVPNSEDFGNFLDRDEHGFLLENQEKGLLPAGCIKHPTEVAESVRDATGAALKAFKWTRG
jgi:quinone-modifying oxidoreductase subunit QmoA